MIGNRQIYRYSLTLHVMGIVFNIKKFISFLLML